MANRYERAKAFLLWKHTLVTEKKDESPREMDVKEGSSKWEKDLDATYEVQFLTIIEIVRVLFRASNG